MAGSEVGVASDASIGGPSGPSGGVRAGGSAAARVIRFAAVVLGALLLLVTVVSLSADFGLFGGPGSSGQGESAEQAASRASGADVQAPVVPGAIALDLTLLAAGGFAVAVGLGRFGRGEGIALLCFAGVAAVSGTLVREVQAPNAPDSGLGRNLVDWLWYARLCMAGGFLVLSAAAVLTRSRAAATKFGAALLVLAPVLAALVWFAVQAQTDRGRARAARGEGAATAPFVGGLAVGATDAVEDGPGAGEQVAKILGVLMASLVGLGLTSVGLAMVIGSFERAGEPEGCDRGAGTVAG